jgi:hypothetical protein
MKITKKKLLIIKSTLVLFALTACASPPNNISVSEGSRSTLVNYSPPEWVLKGAGAFKDVTGKIVWGVSSVSGVKNASLQRIAADDRARNAVAKIFQVHSKSLSKDLVAHAMAGNLEVTSEEQGIETGIKTGVEQVLRGVMIVDHWEHPGRNELFSLARLDLNKFTNISTEMFTENINTIKKEYSQSPKILPEKTKKSIKKSSESFFRDLE